MLPLRPLARAVTVTVAVSAAAAPAMAQCPDGGAPPCRQGSAAARPVAIDRNRVAVLPFRVTTADSLLGEGFAELLAQEFTGEGGPRAVEMSTLLRTWRRTGGSLRNALPQDTAMLVARSLGAGILAQGTIVGLGGRLSISASLVNSSTAQPLGAPARVAGPADSVESLLRQVAASLLGTGASERVLKSARLSKSPAALRAYFEGLALMRRGRMAPAARAFEASIAADSLFASALYQRWLIGQAYAGGGIVATVPPERVRTRLDLLTPRERTVFEAYVPPVGVVRPRMQVYTDRRRAAERLGDSPDAWFMVGDYVYHDGHAVVGPDSLIPLARQFFSLAVGLDTQPVFLFHLTEIAVNTRDTALMRGLLGAYGNVEGEDQWGNRWILASGLGDEPMLASLRRAAPRNWSNVSLGPLSAVMDSRVPVSKLEEAANVLATTGRQQELLGSVMWAAEVSRGRLPAAAPHAPLMGTTFGSTAVISGDGLDSVTLAKFGPGTLPDSNSEARRQCLRARLALERGEPVALDSSSIRLIPRCRIALQAMDAFRRGTLSDSAITRLDTLVTNVRMTSFLGFEHRLLARIYEARGDTARAVRAIRLYPHDYGGAWSAPTYREAGRYFLIARDTARAVAAYERYLELRAEAQPPLIAERDSVRAIVTTLTRRFTP